jgi:hypothetical protein
MAVPQDIAGAEKERPPKGPLLPFPSEDAYEAVSVIVEAAPLLKM